MSKSLSNPSQQFEKSLIKAPAARAPWTQAFLVATLLCVVVLWASALRLATNQPWLGITLVADAPPAASPVSSPPAASSQSAASTSGLLITSVDADGPSKALPQNLRLLSVGALHADALALEANDFLEEPDVIPTYAQWDQFYMRQQRMVDSLRAGSVTLVVQNAQGVLSSHIVRAAPSRPVSSLPLVFWFQLFVAGFAALVGAWVFSVRWHDWSARCLALTGYGLLLSAGSASVYSSRELAMARDWFHLLSGGNHTGAIVFGIGLVGIFMFHPQRLVATPWFFVMALVFLLWNVADVMWWLPMTDLGNRSTILMLMLMSIGLGVWQWIKSRGRLADRAALRWVLLFFLFGSGSYVALMVCSVLLGWIPPIAQGYAFGLFLSMYIGLALGVRRYRLFDMDVWSLRTLMWLFGVLGIVLLDGALISVLHWNNTASLAVSMLVCAALYFPIRQWLWDRVFRRKSPSLEALTGELVALALVPAEQRQQHRKALFGTLFSPANFDHHFDQRVALASSGSDGEQVQLLEQGLGLQIPATADMPALQLWQRDQGRRLFSSQDARLAKRLHDLSAMVLQTRDAYQRGAAAERERIAGDLHDDLGARLLSIVHSSSQDSGNPQLAATARMALDDMRLSVRELTAKPALASTAMADWRSETMQRLEQVGFEVQWENHGHGQRDGMGNEESAQDDQLLSARLQVQFTRILREAVSNVIRHSGAKRCVVQVSLGKLQIGLSVADDGRGLGTPASGGNKAGYGLVNIERRTRLLGGSHSVGTSVWGGVLIQAQLPLTSSSS